jgi:hypothetical protein
MAEDKLKHMKIADHNPDIPRETAKKSRTASHSPEEKASVASPKIAEENNDIQYVTNKKNSNI